MTKAEIVSKITEKTGIEKVAIVGNKKEGFAGEILFWDCSQYYSTRYSPYL